MVHFMVCAVWIEDSYLNSAHPVECPEGLAPDDPALVRAESSARAKAERAAAELSATGVPCVVRRGRLSDRRNADVVATGRACARWRGIEVPPPPTRYASRTLFGA